MKKIYNILVGLVVVLVLAALFPSVSGLQFFVVQSGSMEPAVKTGALVAVKPAPQYAVGDVITFGPLVAGKAPTTHRIYSIAGTGVTTRYTTKGDANNAPDLADVTGRDIIGRVRLSIAYVGYVVAALQTRYGFLLLILIPAVWIIVAESKVIYDFFHKTQS